MDSIAQTRPSRWDSPFVVEGKSNYEISACIDAGNYFVEVKGPGAARIKFCWCELSERNGSAEEQESEKQPRPQRTRFCG
jgi:hypothetical protein